MDKLLEEYAGMVYAIAAKYSNKSVFQHWFKAGCRIPSQKDLMPQREHVEDDSNATL